MIEKLSSHLIAQLKQLWCAEYSSDEIIWVRASEQKLYFLEHTYVIYVFPCSTAVAGLGNKADSMCTPIGWHEIAEKIGDNLPEGAIFKDRQWNGKIWNDADDDGEELILSRILWLSGLEEGLNKGGDVDSYNRYIYIHGTNQENFLGTARSKGCIRLSNKDVIELFSVANQKGRVLISK